VVEEEQPEPESDDVAPSHTEPETSSSKVDVNASAEVAAPRDTFGNVDADVPVPGILSDIVNTSDNIETRATADYEPGDIEAGRKSLNLSRLHRKCRRHQVLNRRGRNPSRKLRPKRRKTPPPR